MEEGETIPMDKEGFALCFTTSSILVVEKEEYDRNHMGYMESSSVWGDL